MKTLTWLFPLVLCSAVCIGSAQGPLRVEGKQLSTAGAHQGLHGAQCIPGTSPRLTIINNCSESVWAILTPGGNPTQVEALANSGEWFRRYAQHEYYIDPGAPGSMAATSNQLKLQHVPNDDSTYFVTGQFIKVVGAGAAGSDLPTEITAVTVQDNLSPQAIGQGMIVSTALQLLTLDQPPAPQFAVNNWILIQGAGVSGSDLVTRVAGVDIANKIITLKDPASTAVAHAEVYADDRVETLTLKDPAQTAVTNAPVLYNRLVGAVALDPSEPLDLCIPDPGAPGTNFSFHMGCPNDDPFYVDQYGGCKLGASAGDLAGINTLYEPTFGCVYPPINGQPDPRCAFNPADATAACQLHPTDATCGRLSGTDYFDISAVDGYTMPLKVVANGTKCMDPSGQPADTKDASMLDLASCPDEDSTTLYSTDAQQQAIIAQGISLLVNNTHPQQPPLRRACAAPYKWFQLGTQKLVGTPPNPNPTPVSVCASGTCNSVSYYAGDGCDTAHPDLACPKGSGPQQRVGPKQNGEQAIHNTHWVQQLYALGYTGYTWQYGDGVGTMQCDAGSNSPGNVTTYTVTLCPNGGTPYATNALWKFVQLTGNCIYSGTGTPDGQTTFASLVACQQANMLYTCDDLTASDPYKIPTAYWKADPQATKQHKGSTYAAIQQLQQQPETLKCDDFTVDTAKSALFPNGVTVTVPICYYDYAPGNTLGSGLCPAGALGGKHGGKSGH